MFDDKGELILIQALQAHQGDTGGKDPGGFTLEATDIFTEGLAIPCLKLVHRGEKRRDVIKLLERNNRFPSFAGDLAAMIGGVQLAVKRLQDVTQEVGHRHGQGGDQLQHRAHRKARARGSRQVARRRLRSDGLHRSRHPRHQGRQGPCHLHRSKAIS